MLTARQLQKRLAELSIVMNTHAVAQLVEALRYKLEGREFNSRWCHWIFY
jgi:hypothetical protein